MSISLYQATTPVLVRGLNNLSQILQKGLAHAEARGFDPAILLQSRLAPDMLPLIRQVQITSDTARGGIARLAGQEVPSWEDTETSFAELHTRLIRTIDFVESVAAEDIDAGLGRPVELKFKSGSMQFDSGLNYLQSFVIPNFYFHITTTYALLRNNGVPLGKADYLGPIKRA